MGNGLFGADIAGDLADAMGDDLMPITLVRKTRSALSDNPTGPGTTSTATHTARGFKESYRLSLVDGEAIKRGDIKVSILGDTIKPALAPNVEPGPNDRITIGGRTYAVVALDSVDPDAAVYVVQCRGV
jgi:hypothetical protein